MAELTNHLWQSTLFAAFVALAAFALKKNQARTRYGLWLAASVKFLVPFSFLISLGTQVDLPSVAPTMPAVAVEQITSTFAPAPAMKSTKAAPSGVRWPMVAASVWAAGALFLMGRWFRRWLTIRTALRQATRLPIAAAIPVHSAPTNIEPGVFGVIRPVMLLPEGIVEKLSSEELDAILMHELTHVRRHDNLTAALHMAVEVGFWFHPLIWWIGNRLVEERERACDEAVLEAGRAPLVYAQGILNVCKYYVESPLPCAAGVSGADLRKRIEEIMTQRNPLRLTMTRASLLAAAVVTVLSVPLAIGVLRAQTLPPPPQHKFEVASIRPGDPNSQQVRIMPGPQGGLRTENTTALTLITFAYDVRDFQVTGGPSWLKTERYNLTGTPDKPEEPMSAGMDRAKFESQHNRQRERVQALLMERFGLVLRAETKEMPVYGLSVMKSGLKMKVSDGARQGPNIRMQRGRMMVVGASMKMITNALSQMVGRPVVDESGLQGNYDMELEWTPDGRPGEPAAAETSGPSIFTAIQEQLGLKLESKKGPAPVFVIEKIEKPSEN